MSETERLVEQWEQAAAWVSDPGGWYGTAEEWARDVAARDVLAARALSPALAARVAAADGTVRAHTIGPDADPWWSARTPSRLAEPEQWEATEIDRLVSDWAEVVEELEDGYRDALVWEDYLNDLDARQAVEDALAAEPALRPRVAHRLSALDARARAALEPVTGCLWGADAEAEEGWTPERNWWYYAIPRNASAALRAALRGEGGPA